MNINDPWKQTKDKLIKRYKNIEKIDNDFNISHLTIFCTGITFGLIIGLIIGLTMK